MTKPKGATVESPAAGLVELDKAAAKIVDVVGIPSLRDALADRAELRGLTTEQVVELVAASLAENLFTGPESEDVRIDFDGEFLSVPASERELLRAAITRTLAARAGELAKLMGAKQ